MSYFQAEALLPGLAKSTQTMIRLTLFPSETLRLPPSCRAVTIRAGAAWISYDGRDIQLPPGETMTFSGNDCAVVSALGDFALVLELKEK